MRQQHTLRYSFQARFQFGSVQHNLDKALPPTDASRSGSQRVGGTAGNGSWFPAPETMCYCLGQQSSDTSCIPPRTRRPAACKTTWVMLPEHDMRSATPPVSE